MSHDKPDLARRCRIWETCPLWTKHPKLDRETCMGTWGHDCLIWKELDIMKSNYGINLTECRKET